MKYRWAIAPFLVICFALLAGFIWARFSASRYQGKSAHYWAFRYSNAWQGDPEAEKAIKTLGANAVPALTYIATATNATRIERVVQALVTRLPRRLAAHLQLPPDPPYSLPIRANAMTGLGLLGPEAATAIPALASVMQDREHLIPSIATVALGRIGVGALQILTNRLHDTNVFERRQAAYALGLVRTNSRNAMPILYEAAFHDPARNVSDTASNSLVEIAWAAPDQVVEMLFSSNAPEREVAAYLCGLRPSPNQRIVPRLMELSRHDELTVRRRAAWSLARLVVFHPEAVQTLSDGIKDPDQAMRQAAFHGLGRAARKSPAVIGLLLNCLTNSDSNIRELACQTLGMLGPAAKSAIPNLQTAESDQSTPVRLAATAAIKALQEP